MRVVFRVDASLQMGTGHVMRCLTLAQVLKENDTNVEFICRKHQGNLIDKIYSNGFNAHELEVLEEIEVDNKLTHSHWLGATQQQDASECIKVLDLEKVDWIIVDHYALDEDWQRKLKPYCKKLMVIDDLADRQFDCDILLNQNLGTKKQDYQNKVPKKCQLLLGCDYTLLRSEFSQLRKKSLEKRKITKGIKNILISIGGSDVDNITYDILQQLDGRFNIVAVLGKVSPHNKMIESYVKGKNVKVVVDADNMAELMFDADFTIGAGGSTSWERCCLGLPALLYITAENQRMIAENLEKIGAVKIIKNLEKDLQAMNNDFYLWKSMSEESSKICDGLGASRVLECLL
jgi:UDP-2,4-diacetamido-2,4,6-trideoxy-beta-L-altropyranose hydrolase